MSTLTPDFPWTISTIGKRNEIVSVVCDGAPIADIRGATVGDMHKHAAVIAAAPELLAALKMLVRVYGPDMQPEHRSLVRGLIAKAEDRG